MGGDRGTGSASLAEQWQVNKYLWICLLFLAVYLPFAQAKGWTSVPLGAAYLILLLGVANGALRTYSGWKRGGANAGPIAWGFTLADIALLSVGIRITGGLHSELWVVYFVLLVSEALHTSPRETSLLTGAMAAGYLGATWDLHAEPGYWLTMATRLFFLFLLGSFVRRLSANREARARETLRLREQVAASEERARIAREVHDGLGHALVSVILRLELCRRLIRNKPEEAEQILQEEVPALRAAWNEGRDLAFHLRPWERDEAGFAETLRRHARRFAERTGIAVDVKIEPQTLSVPANTEMALTRTIQEALTNVARHSRAKRVSLEVRRITGSIVCRIEDDGVGFAVGEKEMGFGLTAMRERAERLGGTLQVQSRPESGTLVEVVIPDA